MPRWSSRATVSPGPGPRRGAGRRRRRRRCGRAVLPGFVDSHAHLAFAGERGAEFAARMSGQPYQAGGIRSTVAATRAASDELLRANLRRLAAEMLPRERRRSSASLATGSPWRTRRGRWRWRARSRPRSRTWARTWFRPSSTVTRPPTSSWSAVTCWRPAPRRRSGSTCSASAVRSAPMRRARSCAAGNGGLQARIHANQLGPGPGVQVAVEAEAASADHCTFLSDADVDALASSGGTVATLLPGAEFSTASPIRTPAGCSTRASPSRSPRTATRVRATPRACRSASRSRSGRCG